MTRFSVPAAVVVLALALVGCGGGTENGPDEPPSGASTAAPSPTESALSESESATSEPASGVAPAAGPTLQVEGVRLNAPLVFSSVPDPSSLNQVAYPRDAESYVSVYHFPNSEPFDADTLAGEALRAKWWSRTAKRLDDATIDDEPVYHVGGPQKDGTYREDFGTIVDGEQVEVSFVFADGEPASYRKDVIASVLETVDFGEESVVLPEAGSIPPAPARGPFIKLPQGRLRIPIYWVTTDLPLVNLDGAFPKGVVGTSISLITTPAANVTDLDGLPAASGMDRGWKTPAERLDDVEIDGQPALHQAGQVAPKQYVEQFAVLVGDQQLAVTFTFANDESPAYRDEIVASVLPTIDLT